MASIHIDLATRVLSHDHEVYVARPGKKSSLYLEAVEFSAVLLDLPGLQFQPDLPIEGQPHLLAQLRRAQALKRWYRSDRSGDEPSFDLKDYDDETQDRSVSQLVGAARAYFERLKVGDLVILPPQAYSKDAYVGEVVDTPLNYEEFSVKRYGDSKILGRQVRWLATIPKRKLPPALIDALEKPSPMFMVARSIRPQFYDTAYGSYSIEGINSSRFEVTGADYDLDSDIQISAFAKLIAANVRSQVLGEAPILQIGEAAFMRLGEFSPELKSNINSPGFMTLAATAITPLVVAVLFAVAISVEPEAALNAAQNGLITFGNSAAPPNDECAAEVYAEAVRQLKLYGLDDWSKACEQARAAAEAVGIKTTPRVTVGR